MYFSYLSRKKGNTTSAYTTSQKWIAGLSDIVIVGSIVVGSALTSIRVAEAAPVQSVSTYSGSGSAMCGYADGTVSTAQYILLSSITFDPSGNMYMGDSYNNRIRRIDTLGNVTTLAGAGGAAGYVDGPAGGAKFGDFFAGITTDNFGSVYVSDIDNHAIRKISGGNVITIVGDGVSGNNDGVGTGARLMGPAGIVFQPTTGDLYIGDGNDCTIRKMDTLGNVTTIAGTHGVCNTAGNTLGSATFDGIWGMVFGTDPNILYVAESASSVIRKIDLGTGDVSIVAGQAYSTGLVDGLTGVSRLQAPRNLARNTAGQLYITDENNHAVRVLNPATNELKTVAGDGTANYTDGALNVSQFNMPKGMGISPISNKLYVSDMPECDIRSINIDIDNSLTKTVDISTPLIGNNVTFTITVTNSGPYDSTNVSVEDSLPSGYSFVSATPSQGSWSAPTWTVGTLTPGQSETLQIVATVLGTGSYTNFTQIKTADGNDIDSMPASNTGSTPIEDDEAVASVNPTSPTAALGNFVWIDTNANGSQDIGEVGLDGVTVNLLSSTGVVIGTGTTASTVNVAGGNPTGLPGYYYFSGLTIDDYQVQFTLPSGYSFSPANNTGDGTDSDANTITGITGTYSLTGGENNLTIDAGIYQKAALGNLVWNDTNKNGVQDVGETGVDGVTVNLLSSTGAVIATGTTSSTVNVAGGNPTGLPGYYYFSNLDPGTYAVRFTPPSGYVLSMQDNAGDTTDSDANISNGTTSSYTLSSGDNNLTIDAGIYQEAALGNFVWIDTDSDGEQDGGESGIDGVTVNLLSSTGAVIGTGVTSSTVNVAGGNPTGLPGYYYFSGLTIGTYAVKFVLPTGYTFTSKDTVGDASDSDADIISGITTDYVLTGGENNLTIDAGIIPTASLGNFVWIDTDKDGYQDGSETGINGVTVNLLSSTGAIIGTGVTSSTVNVAGGNPTGLPGYYYFPNLGANTTYSIKVNPPSGYTLTTRGSDTASGADSNVDPLTGISSGYTLSPLDNNLTLDAGLYQIAALGNFVWEDLNKNGSQDPGEPGVDGVTVNLISSTGAIIGTGVTSSTVNVAGGNPTGLPGYYYFPNLDPGTYSVRFSLPSGYSFTTRDSVGDTLDSDADAITGNTISYTISSGDNNLSVDAGIYRKAAVGNFVWIDIDGDGVQDVGETGVDGVTVNLLSSTGAVIATGTTSSTVNVAGGNPTGLPGYYYFSNLDPGTYAVRFTLPSGYGFSPVDTTGDSSDSDANIGTGITPYFTLSSGENNLTVDAGINQRAAIGNVVWIDTNANGIQDVGEGGIDGVTVNLLSSTGAVIGTGVTSSTVNAAGGNPTGLPGYYYFPNLDPGTYGVKFTLPAGYYFTTEGSVLTGATDSNANISTGVSPFYMLSSGENNLTIDAGIYQKAALGNVVWIDLDADGIQDVGESGIDGVTVNLLSSTGAIIGTGVTASTVSVAGGNPTGLPGYYYFSNLDPGNYQVQFQLPSGYNFSTPDTTTDSSDSDAGVVSGLSAIYSLGSGDNNLTIDAGIYRNAALGNFVWLDINKDGIQTGTGETGINGVTLQLIGSTGAVIGTTTTNNTINSTGGNLSGADGYYYFSDLKPGTYSIRVVLPSNYAISPQGTISTGTTDSNINPITLSSSGYTLVSGDNNLTLDAGIYLVPVVVVSGGGGGGGGSSGIPTTPPSPTTPTTGIPPSTPTVVIKKEVAPPSTKKIAITPLIERIKREVVKVEFILPKKLLDTGATITKNTLIEKMFHKGVKIVEQKSVITDPQVLFNPWSYNLDNAPKGITYWTYHLPKEDKNADMYIVIPTTGVVTPVMSIPEDTRDFSILVSGKETNVQPYLQNGVLHYPKTANPGEYGNMVVAGHSSYFTWSPGRFKTIFGTLPSIEAGKDEIWVYRKITRNEYMLYRYQVIESYNTVPTNVEIMLPRTGKKEITLYTCTPIGGLRGRWIIRAEMK